MKKIYAFIPPIVAAIIISIVIGLAAVGAFNAPEETVITSSTLTEVIRTAKLTTAEYIQHGIAKAHIEGTKDGYILYYAIVRANVDMAEITFDINHNEKIVTVVVPERFTFDVELLEDKDHKFRYYPKKKDDWTATDVAYICETDAKQKAEDNAELSRRARESLVNALENLLYPILTSKDYTLVVEVPSNQGV
ncbi:MAG: DUF4230 domain-containing protein [Oscillospiraceae bacterium]|nr:DUF4230 domain-containing protein [Oscillospiraceae bacterium]